MVKCMTSREAQGATSLAATNSAATCSELRTGRRRSRTVAGEQLKKVRRDTDLECALNSQLTPATAQLRRLATIVMLHGALLTR